MHCSSACSGRPVLWSLAKTAEEPLSHGPSSTRRGWPGRRRTSTQSSRSRGASVLDRPEERNREQNNEWLKHHHGKGAVMPVNYKVDPRNDAAVDKSFENRVDQRLQAAAFNFDANDKAAIKGILIVDGYGTSDSDELDRGFNA